MLKVAILHKAIILRINPDLYCLNRLAVSLLMKFNDYLSLVMRPILNILITVVITSIVTSSAFSADVPVKAINEINFKSSIQQTVIIELFTSQGCSSCPPAEKYLNSFVGHPELWKTYIPVAFHVDYWDYIGWKDLFAKPQHGIRHRKYAKLGHTSAVYTPAFMVNGKSWRKNFFRKHPEVKRKTVGTLSLTINNRRVLAKFEQSIKKTSNLILNFVVLGLGFETQIRAGEREGRTSKHEFVVLDHKTKKSNNNRWSLKLQDFEVLTRKLINKPERFAVAAWVSKQGDPTPIQAVGGLLK